MCSKGRPELRGNDTQKASFWFLRTTLWHVPSCLVHTDHNNTLHPGHLQLPDLLALLGHLPHRLPHQGNQHVKQQDKGEDDVGHQQDEEHGRILGAVNHVQLSHPNGQLEEVQQERAEGVGVPALWVGGAVTITLAARWRANCEKGNQGCGEFGE